MCARRQRGDDDAGVAHARQGVGPRLEARPRHHQRRAHRRPQRLAIQRIDRRGIEQHAGRAERLRVAQDAADVVGLGERFDDDQRTARRRGGDDRARVLRRRPLGDRQAAAMEMEAADRVDDLGRGEVERQIRTGVEAVGGLRAQRGEAGLADEDRADRVAGEREQPGDDQPALGDEQAAPPHELGLADGAVVEDARVVRR